MSFYKLWALARTIRVSDETYQTVEEKLKDPTWPVRRPFLGKGYEKSFQD